MYYHHHNISQAIPVNYLWQGLTTFPWTNWLNRFFQIEKNVFIIWQLMYHKLKPPTSERLQYQANANVPRVNQYNHQGAIIVHSTCTLPAPKAVISCYKQNSQERTYHMIPILIMSILPKQGLSKWARACASPSAGISGGWGREGFITLFRRRRWRDEPIMEDLRDGARWLLHCYQNVGALYYHGAWCCMIMAQIDY